MKIKGLTEKILVGAGLCLLAVIIAPHVINHAPEDQSAQPPVGPVIDSLPSDPTVVKPPAQLVFDDPGQYGIITPDEWGSMPAEDQIRTTIREQMQLLKETTPPETWDKVHQIIDAPAEQTVESVRKLDEHVALLKKKLEDDPFDSQAKQQIELLIILRTAAEELAPDTVPPPQLPQAQEEGSPKEVEILIE